MHAMKRLCGIAAALMLGSVPCASMAQNNPPPETKPQFVMKLATATLNDGNQELMKRFAAAIATKSGGRIKAEVYPASQLGSIPRMIEGTQLGSIQMYLGPPEFLAGIDPRFELLSAPGLVEGDTQAVKLISDPEFAKAFLAIGDNKGIIGASLFIAGPTAFVTRAAFRTLADLEGKKIRVLASPFQREQIARLGATGVPMSLGDVAPALQQGTIDGAIGALSTFTALGLYDAAKYMNETNSSYIFVLVAMSKRWFGTLPADLQAMVLATVQEATAETIPWQIDFSAQQRKVWTDKGGVIDVLSPADRAEMAAKLSTVGDDIVKTKPELQPMWNVLRAAADHSRN